MSTTRRTGSTSRPSPCATRRASTAAPTSRSSAGHHRLLVRARARRGGPEASGSSRRARSPAARADGTAGSRFAAARRRIRCWPSRSAATRPPALWRWTEARSSTRSRDLAGDAFRATGQPAAGGRRRGARRAARGVRGASSPPASPPSGARISRAPLAGRYPAALFHPPDGVLQPARLVRRLADSALRPPASRSTSTRIGSLDEARRR